MTGERPQTPTAEAFAFRHPIRVRWADVDPQGVVFNPTYFVYFDVAFTEYMRTVGVPFQAGLVDLGVDMYTVSATANHRGSARYDDMIEVAARVGRIGRSSVRFDFLVTRDEEPLVDGAVTYVVVDLEHGEPVAVPAPFVEAVQAFEAVPPER